MRTIVRTAAVISLVGMLTIVLAGCGGSSGSGSASDSKAEASGAAEGGGTGEDVTATLDVRLDGVGDKGELGPPVPSTMKCTRSIPAQCSATIECPSAGKEGGPMAPSAELCAWIGAEAIKLLTAEIPENEACTMIYGGPATATVKGVIGDTEIDAKFSREHGCAIARWDSIEPLWTGEIAPPDGSAPPDAAPPGDPDAPVSSGGDEPDVVDDPPEAFGR